MLRKAMIFKSLPDIVQVFSNRTGGPPHVLVITRIPKKVHHPLSTSSYIACHILPDFITGINPLYKLERWENTLHIGGVVI